MDLAVNNIFRLCFEKTAISETRRLNNPRSEIERSERHQKIYGNEKIPIRGSGLRQGRRRGRGFPKADEQRKSTHKERYGNENIPTQRRGLSRVR